MKLKSLILLLFLFNLCADAQIYYSANVGANLGSVRSKNGADEINPGNYNYGTITKGSIDRKPSNGGIISGNVNIPLTSKLLLQAGLGYELLNYKINANYTIEFKDLMGNVYVTGEVSIDAKAKLHFINVPVKLFYQRNVKNITYLIGAGPYLGIGIDGKGKSKGYVQYNYSNYSTKANYDYSKKIKFGANDDATFKRLNVGVSINVACILPKNILVKLYSDFGLTNFYNSDSYSLKPYTIGLTGGYIFGRKRKKEE